MPGKAGQCEQFAAAKRVSTLQADENIQCVALLTIASCCSHPVGAGPIGVVKSFKGLCFKACADQRGDNTS